MNDVDRYQRMADRNRERERLAMVDQARAEMAADFAERATWPNAAYGPAIGEPPLGEGRPISSGRHNGHRVHGLGPFHGNSFWCSCGEFWGITSVVLTDDMPPRPDHCWICRARGIEHLTGP